METEAITTLLSGNSFVVFIVAAVSLGNFLIKLFTGAFILHNDYFVSRQVNRIVKLRSAIEDNPSLKLFINTMADDKIFRVATGIKATPDRANALMQLYQTAKVSKAQLKAYSSFLQLNDAGELKISNDNFDKFTVYYSLFAGVLIFSCTLWIAITIVSNWTVSTTLSGALIFLIGVFATSFMLRDFTVFRQLQKLQKQLPQLAVDATTPKASSTTSAPLPPAQQPAPTTTVEIP